MCGSCCIDGREEIVLRLTPPNEPGGKQIKNVKSEKCFDESDYSFLIGVFKKLAAGHC